MLGPRIQGSAQRRHPKSKEVDFGRIVDVRGLLSRQEVGASAALLGTLRGWNSSSWNFKIVLDDEFWYVTVTRTVSLGTITNSTTILVRQNGITKNARI